MIYLSVGKSLTIPETCPDAMTSATQLFAMLLLTIFMAGEFGDCAAGIDLYSTEPIRWPNLGATLVGLRGTLALFTYICSFYLIRASGNPVDVVKDCLALTFIVQIPQLVFYALQRGGFGRTLML